MTFIYDTGSAWFWVPTELWKTWPTKNKFKIDESDTLEILSVTPEVLIYGTGEVGGIRLKDTVWLEKKGDQKVNGLDMLGIIVANGIDGDQADGILGLGPLKSDSSRTNFVSALKKEGLIDHEMFSINFKMEGKQSKMIFGDIDMKIVSNLNDIIWIPVLDKSNSDYWKLPLSSVQYGSKKLETQAKYGVIDTGSSTMAFSELNFLYLMKEILDSGLEWGFILDEKFVAWVCKNGPKDFKPIKFNINDHIFSLDPDDYVVTEEDVWIILVYNLGDRAVVDDDTIVLGTNFLRKYYTVFDLEKDRVGIYLPQKSAAAKASSKASYLNEFIFLGLITVFTICTWIVYIYLKYKDKEVDKNLSDLSIGQIDNGKMHSHVVVNI